jgi:hypothetical protein
MAGRKNSGGKTWLMLTTSAANARALLAAGAAPRQSDNVGADALGHVRTREATKDNAELVGVIPGSG